MTEEEKNEDTRDVDPVAQKLAELCDALGVDPLSDGWLEGCTEAAKRFGSDEVARTLAATREEAERYRLLEFERTKKCNKLQEKLDASEKKRVDLEALYGKSQLKLGQTEAKVAELDQELRTEREKADRMRDRSEVVRLRATVQFVVKALMDLAEKIDPDPMFAPNPPKSGEMPTRCHICQKPKGECTCQNEVEVKVVEEKPPRVEGGLVVSERTIEANLPPDPMRRVPQEVGDGGTPKGAAFWDRAESGPSLEKRHQTKVGQFESTHLDPMKEASKAADRLDKLQKDNRKKLGSLESTVAQGVHDFARQLKSIAAPTPLDDVAEKIRKHNNRAAGPAETIPDALPEWTDEQDAELRQNLARLKVGTGWSGKGPRANVTDLQEPDEDGGEPFVEYQIDEEVRKRGNELAEKRVLPVTEFFGQFPSCVYTGPSDPMRDRVPGPGW